jgi:hypothetical protein
MHQELVALFPDRWETRSISNTTQGSVYYTGLSSGLYLICAIIVRCLTMLDDSYLRSCLNSRKYDLSKIAVIKCAGKHHRIMDSSILLLMSRVTTVSAGVSIASVM